MPFKNTMYLSLQTFGGAYKEVLSSLGLACATKSDHNIELKSFISPGQTFFNSAIVSYSLFSVNNYLRPFKSQR